MEKFFACAAWSVVLPTVPQFCTARDKAGRKARAKRTRIFPTCSDYRVDGCLCAQDRSVLWNAIARRQPNRFEHPFSQGTLCYFAHRGEKNSAYETSMALLISGGHWSVSSRTSRVLLASWQPGRPFLAGRWGRKVPFGTSTSVKICHDELKIFLPNGQFDFFLGGKVLSKVSVEMLSVEMLYSLGPIEPPSVHPFRKKNKKGILSLICGVCNSSSCNIPTKQGCEKESTFWKKVEKFHFPHLKSQIK